MKLNYKKFGQGKPIIILHGLLGMLDNWQTIGKTLSENYEVFLVDARNHGHSPHTDVFNYDAMAEDMYELLEDEKISSAILIGHSMGGKTAMKFAQKYPEKIEKLIIVDIAPKYYPTHHDQIFEALLAVDFSIAKSRKEAEEILEKFIPENYIRQFLLKNLFWKEGENLAWRFNLEAIYKNLEKVGEATTPLSLRRGVGGEAFSKPTLFLRGEKSNYITEEDFEQIKNLFPQSEIKTIPNAGHWIHAEQPEFFMNAVKKFLFD